MIWRQFSVAVNPFKTAPFLFTQKHYIPLKMHGFSDAGAPCIEVKIGPNSFIAEVDTGWGGSLAAEQRIVEPLTPKKWIGRSQSQGLLGHQYEADVYELPEMHLGMVQMSFVKIKIETPEFITDSILGPSVESLLSRLLRWFNFHSSIQDHSIRMGWQIFRPLNVLMDCQNQALVLVDSVETLRQCGYERIQFIEIPMELDRGLIEIAAMTDLGSVRCVLDSGSTVNYFNQRKDVDVCPQWVQIEGHEFGSERFRLIQSPLEIEAILGMEFFKKHLIFFDFRQQKVYISE